MLLVVAQEWHAQLRPDGPQESPKGQLSCSLDAVVTSSPESCTAPGRHNIQQHTRALTFTDTSHTCPQTWESTKHKPRNTPKRFRGYSHANMHKSRYRSMRKDANTHLDERQNLDMFEGDERHRDVSRLLCSQQSACHQVVVS